MPHALKTVAVTSEAWPEPVRINADDFDPAVHKVAGEPATGVSENQAAEPAEPQPARKRGRPPKAKETPDNANG
jgi:hypothetical protein